MGRLRGRGLRVGAVSVADVFTCAFWSVAAFLVRRTGATSVVAVVPALLRRRADSDLSAELPHHLLLLPRRLLQGVLGRSAGMRGRRAAQDLLGRAKVP